MAFSSSVPLFLCKPNPFPMLNLSRVSFQSHRKPPRYLRYPRRRARPPPDPGIPHFPSNPYLEPSKLSNTKDDDHGSGDGDEDDDAKWSPDELEAISSLFERGGLHKPVKRSMERPQPLPLPYKIRPLGFPTPKRHVRAAARSVLRLRGSYSDGVRKNPDALVALAKEIAGLPADVDACEVLDHWSPFLRKGSLSLTVKQLGHMGLPDRALQTLFWAQKHRPEFFPDDRILASTVEVLAGNWRLRLETEMEYFLSLASRSVVEAMARGFIRAGQLHRARKLLLLAKDQNRTLDASIHVKLMLEAVKTPDGYKLASALLDELREREELDLKSQDCTAIMKVCIKLGRIEIVESLFNWFKQSGKDVTVVMYTTVIHSRYCDKKYREGLALVWEMEGLNLLLDLPAYRVVIRLCVAVDDLARAARYFSRLKESGFSPTYDIYRDMIKGYAASGRWAKCKQICKEVEMAGLKLDAETLSVLS